MDFTAIGCTPNRVRCPWISRNETLLPALLGPTNAKTPLRGTDTLLPSLCSNVGEPHSLRSAPAHVGNRVGHNGSRGPSTAGRERYPFAWDSRRSLHLRQKEL